MMNKIDFNLKMEQLIEGLKNKPSLLLHICCAPCSSSVLERIYKKFEITVFFYNPNMDTEEEFEKRKAEAEKFIKKFNEEYFADVKFVSIPYNHNDFLDYVKGLEKEKEGGSRCEKCFHLRLLRAKKYAEEHDFDYLTTTLTVSPYKNSDMLNNIGIEICNEKVKYLVSDFKKKDGYKRSIELSKKYEMYRQNYCGCEFSKANKELY